VSRAPLGDADAPAHLDEVITRWAAEWQKGALSGTLLGVEHQPLADDKGHVHWLIRLRGEEKNVITVWLSLRQRTVHVETELMPAPEERHDEVYRFVLTKNHSLRELHVALGPEDGLYLVAHVPTDEMSVERLDEIVGATLHYVDEFYPTVMAMGLPSLYRRRRAR